MSGALALLACACSAGQGPDPETYIAARGAQFATANEVAICHGHGCRLLTAVPISDRDWTALKRLLGDAPAEDPASERKRIATAIGFMEREFGGRAGLAGDEGRNIFPPRDDQLDCIDETINTTVYLDLLTKNGFLRWHSVTRPARRGFNSGELWVHETAVIKENGSGRDYVVDTWFDDNGAPAYVVPLALWLDGWLPGDPVPAES